MNQIGTIELLRTRVYPLDAAMAREESATTVVVEAGTYPLFEDEVGGRFWMMGGHINARGFTRHGDGLFTLSEGDAPTGPEVRFPSRTFGPKEWDEFLSENVHREGHPEQRFRINEFQASV